MNLTVLFYLATYSVGLLKSISGKPVWGLYAYFLSFYFHAPSQWWGQSLPSFRWALVAAIVTVLSLLIYPPKRGLRFWEFKENRWLTYLSILVICQIPFVLNQPIHYEYVFLSIKFLLFIFIVQNTVWTAKDVRRLIYINLFGGTYLAYLGMSMHQGGRLEGIGTPGMESANQLGQHFAVLLLVGGYLLLSKFRYAHLFVALALSMILMAIFMTESRGVLASLGLTGIIAMFFIPHKRKKKFSVFAMLAVIAASALMGPQILSRFEGVEKGSDGEMKDASAMSRVVIIKSQWEMAKGSLLFGYGHRGTLILSPSYIPKEYHAQGVGRRASHNVVMAFLVDHGFVGLFMYLMVVFICCKRIFKVKNKVEYVSEEMRENYRELASLKVGCILALICFFVSGLGSNNKKLEGHIWMFAFVPIISSRMKRIEDKNHMLKLKISNENEKN